MIERFVNDNGSAQARVTMLRLFNYVSWTDLVWGPDQALMGSLQYTEGIEYGIESFWVAFILMNGLAMSLLFFVALGAFCWRLWMSTRPATSLLLFFFFFLASTSVSISAKTCAFGMFTAMTLTMMRALPARPGGRAGREAQQQARALQPRD
jgi:hypothetical protein